MHAGCPLVRCQANALILRTEACHSERSEESRAQREAEILRFAQDDERVLRGCLHDCTRAPGGRAGCLVATGTRFDSAETPSDMAAGTEPGPPETRQTACSRRWRDGLRAVRAGCQRNRHSSLTADPAHDVRAPGHNPAQMLRPDTANPTLRRTPPAPSDSPQYTPQRPAAPVCH